MEEAMLLAMLLQLAKPENRYEGNEAGVLWLFVAAIATGAVLGLASWLGSDRR